MTCLCVFYLTAFRDLCSLFVCLFFAACLFPFHSIALSPPQRLLQIDPSKRVSAELALKHPYFQDRPKLKYEMQHEQQQQRDAAAAAAAAASAAAAAAAAAGQVQPRPA